MERLHQTLLQIRIQPALLLRGLKRTKRKKIGCWKFQGKKIAVMPAHQMVSFLHSVVVRSDTIDLEEVLQLPVQHQQDASTVTTIQETIHPKLLQIRVLNSKKKIKQPQKAILTRISISYLP